MVQPQLDASPQERRYPLLHLFAHYRHAKKLVSLTLILAILANASVPFSQHLIGLAFGDLMTGAAFSVSPEGVIDLSGAWLWVAILMGFALTRGIVAWLFVVSSFAVAQYLLHELRLKLFGQIQRLDLPWHREQGSGGIIARTTRDGDKIRDAVVHGARIILETTLFMLGVLVIMAFYHWSLLLSTFIAITSATLLMWLQAPCLVRYDRHAGDRYDRLTQDLNEGVAGARVIKAFGLEAQRIGMFNRLVEHFMGATLNAQRQSEWRLTWPQFIVAMNHSLAAFLGALLVGQGTMEIGQLVGLLMMLLAAVFRIEGLARGFALFYEARASAGRMCQILDANPHIVDGSAEKPQGPLGLICDQVGLQSGERPILDTCSMTIEPGKIVAIVGMSGSGKSTLLSLIPRNQDPSSGCISLCSETTGEHPVQSLRLNDLREIAHLVPQESFLFSASIRDNLLLAQPEASDEDLEEALQAASADDIIAQLPDGIDTLIGERGTTLSGGQKQRICLARAFLAKPSILLLDDSTSALDSVTERRVLDHIVAQQTTVLMSASRLSTVLCADRVVWLEAGTIRAIDSHRNLMEQFPAYGALMGLTKGEAA